MGNNIELEEIWLPVVSYEEFYMVSNIGNVKSLGRVTYGEYRTRINNPKMLKKTPSKSRGRKGKGYFCVRLMDKDGTKKTHLIHRLVAEAFIPNPDNKETVNHIDGDKQNNRITNLEWNTYGENNQHAYDNGMKTDSMRVNMLNSNGETVATFISMHEADRRTGYDYRTIYQICNKKRKSPTEFGWEYAE